MVALQGLLRRLLRHLPHQHPQQVVMGLVDMDLEDTEELVVWAVIMDLEVTRRQQQPRRQQVALEEDSTVLVLEDQVV